MTNALVNIVTFDQVLFIFFTIKFVRKFSMCKCICIYNQVSCKAKKKQAVHNERVSYLQVALHALKIVNALTNVT